MDEKKNKIFLRRIFVICGILLIGAIVSPFLFTRNSILANIDFSATGQIGDTIGGLSAPFIAGIAAVLTFAAFWVQFKFNQQQQIFNEEQIKFNKKQEQDSAVSRFEAIFFELIKIHRENVSEMKIEDVYQGRECFEAIYEELIQMKIFIINHQTILNYLLTQEEMNLNELKKIAYLIVYFGVEHGKENTIIQSTNIQFDSKRDFIEYIFKKIESYSFKKENDFKSYLKLEITDETQFAKFKHIAYTGHQPRLEHYYAHLLQTFKFVTDDPLFKQPLPVGITQQKYIDILVSQLSVHEKALICYHGLSPMGEKLKPYVKEHIYPEIKGLAYLIIDKAYFAEYEKAEEASQ